MAWEDAPESSGWEDAPSPPPGAFNKPREALRALSEAGREVVDVGSGTINMMSWLPRAAVAAVAAAGTAPFMRPKSAITGEQTSLADAFKEALAQHTETGHIPYVGEPTTETFEGTKIPKMEATEYLIGKGFEKAQQLAHEQVGERVMDATNSPILATAAETAANAATFLAPFARLPKSRGARFADALNQDIASREVPTTEPLKPRSENAVTERVVGQGQEQQYRGARPVVQGEGLDRNVTPNQPAQGDEAGGGDRVQQAKSREQVAEELKPRIEKAKADHPDYTKFVQDLAAKLDRPAFIAPVKEFDRALDKAMSDYDGDPSQVSDLLRSTIVVDSPKEVGEAIKRISETAPTLKTRNLYGVTTSGYRDGLAKIKLNGDVTEVQANTPEMVGAKEQAHPLYTLQAKIERKAADEHRDLKPSELKLSNLITSRMKDLYDEAATRNDTRVRAGIRLGRDELQEMALNLMKRGQEAGKAERAALESSLNRSSEIGSSEPGLGVRTRLPSQEVVTPFSRETGKESPSNQYSMDESVPHDEFTRSLGMSRSEMPQINRHEHERFTQFAASRKVEVKPDKAKVSDLIPAQKHYNPDQASQMPEQSLGYPSIVSSDNYILDGTNRYVAQLKRNPNQTIDVLRINLPARRAIALMQAFDKVGRKGLADVGRTPREITKVAAAEGLIRRRGGKIVGGMGAQEVADVHRALDRMEALAREGEHGKHWYEESAKAILDSVGGDKNAADRIAMVLSIASTGTEVKANFTMAAKALEQYAKGEPIKVGTGQKNTAISNYLYKGIIPDSIKVTDFYRSLSESITGEENKRAVTDRWQFRIASGDKSKVTGTEQQYAFASSLADETARRLGWKPAQAQAAMWVATKAQAKFESMVASVRESKASKYADMTYDEMKKIAMDSARTSFASEIEARGWKPPEGIKFPPLEELRSVGASEGADMTADMFEQLLYLNKKARDLGLRDANDLYQQKPRDFNRFAEQWRNEREQKIAAPPGVIDAVSVTEEIKHPSEISDPKVREVVSVKPDLADEETALKPNEQVVIANGFSDLFEAGMPKHLLDAMNGVVAHMDRNQSEALYNLATRNISLRVDVLQNLFEGQRYADLSAPGLKTILRGWLAHETMHSVDHEGVGDRVNIADFLSTQSPRMEMKMVGQYYPALKPVGDIATEAMNAWEFGIVNRTGATRQLSEFLNYPFAADFGAADLYQLELFAQLGRLYHTNPGLMRERLPIAYDAFKEIFDNAGTTVEETRSAIRETLRSQGATARDQGALGRSPESGRGQPQDQGVAANRQTSAGVERVSADSRERGKSPDAADRLKRAFAGRGSPPKIPEGAVPPDGGGGPPLFVRQVNPAVTARMASLAREWFKEHPTERDRDLLISDDVQRHVWSGDIGADYLKRFGLSKEDFSRALRDTVADSARTMAYYSHIFRDMNLSKEDLETLRKAGVPEDALYIRPWWRRVQDLWRSLLVTQLATAARNAETQGVRLGLDGITEALDAGVQRLLGRKNPTSPLSGFESIVKIFTRDKDAIDKILQGHPTQRDRLFANYMSDVSVPRGIVGGAFDKGMSALEKGANALNFFNRFQEFSIRRGVFQAKLDQYLEQKGYSLDELIKTNRLSRIPKEGIELAVNKALTATFAETPPYRSIAKLLIDVANKIPLAALAIPFPRFMYNSLKYLYQYSPLGILSYLGPKERAAFAAGDTSAISKAVVGSALLGAAFAFRNSNNAGEKWYEYKTDDGKIVDLRPFNPFAAYLFVADLAKKYKEGTLYKLTPQDIAQGVLSSNMRAGTGLYLLDNFLNNYFGQTGDEKKFVTKVKELGGNLAAGFFTPFAQLRDLYDQFTQGYSDVKETKEEPIAGPIKRQLPYYSQQLPDASFPTRSGPKRTLDPVIRQLTGIGLQEPKNSFESELDRLGFTQRDVISGSGEAAIDRKYKALMGMLSEKIFVPLVDSSTYQKMSDAQKGVILDEMMNAVSVAVKEGVNATLPPEKQVDMVLRKESPRVKILLKQAGVLQ
jgi:hypothetical protein